MPSKKKDSLLGASAILVATMIWGMTFSFIKDAVATLPPFVFLFWRFGIASILLLFIFGKKIKFSRQTISYGCILGFLLGGTVVFQTIGLQFTSASTASFITGLSVVLVALTESVRAKQWPTLYLCVSVILAISGVALITLSDGLNINQGDVYVLCCTFFFAGYIIFAGKASHIHQPLSLTFLQSIFICLVTAAISLFTTGIETPTEINVWGAILFCSVFASILAFTLQLQFQKYVSATKAAIIFSLEPVFATITAALYLNEQLTLRFFIGALLIFTAILLSEKRSKKKIMPQD